MNTPLSVEPSQAAQWTLELLGRAAAFPFAEFDRVNIVRGLLIGIASGALVVIPAAAAAPADAPPPE
jgi:hypothetical protein